MAGSLQSMENLNILMRMASEGFALSRHYEQMTYTLLAGMIAMIAGLISSRKIVFELSPGMSPWFKVSVVFALLSFTAGQLRYISFSIYQFHIANTQMNIVKGLMAGQPSPGANYPFYLDFTSTEVSAVPRAAKWMAEHMGVYLFLYLLIALFFAFGVIALLGISNQKSDCTKG